MKNLIQIAGQFIPECHITSIKPFGSGHINDSYLVTTTPVSAQDYVLQRINHQIFKNVPQLTENILKVTTHIRERLSKEPKKFPDFQVFQQLQCKTGNYFFQADEGDYWRVIDYIKGSRSYDVVENPEMAYQAGKAFGIFQKLTSDLGANSLYEILPNFHNIQVRLDNFHKTIENDPADRVKTCQKEISFVEQRAGEMHQILRLGESGGIPLRVTHNDTKINNVLFNDRNKAISVVDLDTVMPGYVLYDFGDAIRTGASASAEDEPDLEKVNFNLPLFEAYTKGYLEIARGFLTQPEIDHLAFSAKFMTYLIGLRFLTDHLDGDRYYKIHFPGHNLVRARAQFRLVERMEESFSKMETIVFKGFLKK
ncbi:MAG: aminoglycoside phosphotransferase family protein [Bacteroidetes bacterium]|nr:aminoglycoside phosphotransferase family protein [Bacteroidota bacterium]